MPSLSKRSAFLIKWKNWEYWPFSVLYFPVFFYYGWLALRARSFFFFTAANPKIEFGGMMGEKKSEIFEMIPEEFIPRTFLIQKGNVLDARTKAGKIGYPVIAKPDIGERGAWVKKIPDQKSLDQYTQRCPVDFLIQECVTYPIELGVFFIKYPRQSGQVTSIVKKDFLEVIGDGKQSILEFLRNNPRALLTVNFESEYLRFHGHDIPEKGEKVLIEPIGNHCRGTKFLNGASEIDQKLHDAFNKLADKIPEFYFGRFDLKCQSFDDLRQLKNFKILELNGAGAEPGHIYQPGYSLLTAYKDILWHLRVLADISIQNHKRGIAYWNFKSGYKKWRSHKRYNVLLGNS